MIPFNVTTAVELQALSPAPRRHHEFRCPVRVSRIPLHPRSTRRRAGIEPILNRSRKQKFEALEPDDFVC
jgi:hypothetical protein